MEEEIVARGESVEEEETNTDDVQDDLKKSNSHLLGLLGPTHPGRPHTEEPHVKKTMKNKKEKIELICRVDQDQLGLQEDDYDDLKALFQMFDYDQDGVVSMKEGMGMLRCVGFPVDEPNVSEMTLNIAEDEVCVQMTALVGLVSVDKTGFSLSFNEFLTLMSVKRREEPKGQNLLSSFR